MVTTTQEKEAKCKLLLTTHLYFGFWIFDFVFKASAHTNRTLTSIKARRTPKVLVKSTHKLNWEKQDALEICHLETGESRNWRFDQDFYLWPELSGISHYSSAYQNKGLLWTKDRGLFCLGSVGDWPAGPCAMVWECLSLSHHSMCVHCCMCGIPSLNLPESSKTHPSMPSQSQQLFLLFQCTVFVN